MTRTCQACRQPKRANDFPQGRNQCRPCLAARAKARRREARVRLGRPPRKHAAGAGPSPSSTSSRSDRFLVCPLCGVAGLAARFQVAYDGAVKVRSSGGYKGITWTAAALTSAERELLREALARAFHVYET